MLRGSKLAWDGDMISIEIGTRSDPNRKESDMTIDTTPRFQANVFNICGIAHELGVRPQQVSQWVRDPKKATPVPSFRLGFGSGAPDLWDITGLSEWTEWNTIRLAKRVSATEATEDEEATEAEPTDEALAAISAEMAVESDEDQGALAALEALAAEEPVEAPKPRRRRTAR